jgi:hypothetical protein
MICVIRNLCTFETVTDTTRETTWKQQRNSSVFRWQHWSQHISREWGSRSHSKRNTKSIKHSWKQCVFRARCHVADWCNTLAEVWLSDTPRISWQLSSSQRLTSYIPTITLCVCICVPPIVARQRLGKHIPATTNKGNNRWKCHVLCGPRRIKESNYFIPELSVY